MYDYKNKKSYEKIKYLDDEIIDKCGKIPIIIVGNKIDVNKRKVNLDDVAFPFGEDRPYCEISVKEFQNITSPLLLLIRKLLNRDDVDFA